MKKLKKALRTQEKFKFQKSKTLKIHRVETTCSKKCTRPPESQEFIKLLCN